jgi:hypothetical protein
VEFVYLVQDFFATSQRLFQGYRNSA